MEVDPTNRNIGVKHRGALADFLRSRPERVLEQWEAAERNAHGFAEALRDHLAELMLRVSAHMDRGRGALMVEGISLRAQPAEIASELSLLRTAVFDAWIDDGGGALDPDDVARFARAVDALLAAGLAHWSDGVVRREVTTGEVTAPSARSAGSTPSGAPVVDSEELTALIEILGRELRAPLHAIAFSMAKLQEDSGLPETVRAAMQKTARGSERMVDKIDDVLDFAAVRLRGGIELTRRATNLADVARAVVEREDAAPGARRSRLHAEGDTTGLWDRARLAQLLRCLVVNARKHGEPGTTVEVSIHGNVPGLLDWVAVRVENRGTLSEDALRHLFQPFAGARASSKEHPRGVGLGLFLVNAIARAHGGTVEASSAAGRTSFVVKLPRAPW